MSEGKSLWDVATGVVALTVLGIKDSEIKSQTSGPSIATKVGKKGIHYCCNPWTFCGAGFCLLCGIPAFL